MEKPITIAEAHILRDRLVQKKRKLSGNEVIIIKLVDKIDFLNDLLHGKEEWPTCLK